ncbi:MAG: hypothetical protein QMD43_09120 [Thermodesulfovibrio sp.]|nr:hypothetical protein [Thermodesulfovibrio sp.]
MKINGAILIFIIILVIFCFFFRGEAIEKIQEKPLKPVQPSIQPSPKPPPVVLLPDLIVEKVWLDSHNRIAFTLKNIGNGYIPDDFHGKGNVRVIYGNSQKDYAFRVIDPGKSLIRPGGVVSFTSDIELRSSVRVIVEVDITRQISEAREDNNIFSISLMPKVLNPQEQKVIIKPPEVDVPIKPYDYPGGQTSVEQTLQLLPRIIVIKPTIKDKILKRCDWEIKWRRTGEMRDRVKIKILNEKGDLIYTFPDILPNNEGENLYTSKVWPRPSRPPYGVKIRVETIDGALWGESGVFEILPQELTVISPEKGENFYRDSKIPVRWISKGKFEDNKINLYLLREDNSPETQIVGVPTYGSCYYDSPVTNTYYLQLPENIKPGFYKIVLRDNLSEASIKNSESFEISGVPLSNKPDFIWVDSEKDYPTNTRPIFMVLKNIGAPFKGEVDVRIQSREVPDIVVQETLKFTENNPWQNNQLIEVPVKFEWPKGVCSMSLICEVDKNNKIQEIDENNNVKIIPAFPQSSASLWIMNMRLDISSGEKLWQVTRFGDIQLDSAKGVSLGINSVSMVVDFHGMNCSAKTNTYNPKITYIGPDCQKKEKFLGPVQMKPGEVIPFRTEIPIGLCKDASIEVDTGINRVTARFKFSEKFLSEARPQKKLFPDYIYEPQSVRLGFNRGSKILVNGGSVILEKGDWLWFSRNEYWLELNVIVKLKSSAPYQTRLIFNLKSFGKDFTKIKEIAFEQPEREIELIQTMRMWPGGGVNNLSVLEIIDEKTDKKIFKGIIYCSESFLKETGWRPWLLISQEPHIYLDHQKKEVTIKSFVFNSGGPAKNEKWWLSLEIRFRGQLMQSETWEFNGAREAEFIERVFTFKPIYEDSYTYKLSLGAKNKNILGLEQDDTEKIGSFNVEWRPELELYKAPSVYLDKKKKEVQIKCYVLNDGLPIENQKWWVEVEIISQGVLKRKQTKYFDKARLGEKKEIIFNFQGLESGSYIYKVKLSANDKSILSKHLVNKEGSFNINW